MKSGICKLCMTQRELCDSHALPNSAFKYIFRQSEGKAIVLTDDSQTPIKTSSDSWSDYLLCLVCEKILNDGFDQYGIAVFRGDKGHTRILNEGILFGDVDKQRLRMFFLSLLWRISISPHDSYRNIDLPYVLKEELRDAFFKGTRIRGSLCTVAIYRLRDSTKTSGFSHDGLREMITSPFARKYQNGQVSICFLFFGYLVEIFISKLPTKYLSRPGVICGSETIFLAPYLEILEVKEIVSIFAKSIIKHDNGLSNID